jgi:hypothetical protein
MVLMFAAMLAVAVAVACKWRGGDENDGPES